MSRALEILNSSFPFHLSAGTLTSSAWCELPMPVLRTVPKYITLPAGYLQFFETLVSGGVLIEILISQPLM